MVLDMLKLCCLVECRNIPIQMPEPFMDSWISMSNIPDVTLEVLNVDGVETNNCWVEANINLCKFFTEEICSIGVFKYFFNAVEGVEKNFHMFLIHLLDAV